MSPKVQAFLEEVRVLCRKYRLQFATTGYSRIGVLDLEEGEDEFYGFTLGVADWTEDSDE